jgi:hypothetical protein
MSPCISCNSGLITGGSCELVMKLNLNYKKTVGLDNPTEVVSFYYSLMV